MAKNTKEVDNNLLQENIDEKIETDKASVVTKETIDTIYVLLADGDGTMRSIDTPFGVAVTTEKEAKRFVEEGRVGYTHSYAKLTIKEQWIDITQNDLVYILLIDGDGTMSSKEKPFGVAVTTEDEAKNFVQESNQGYYRTYQELKIFKDKDKGIQWKFTTKSNS